MAAVGRSACFTRSFTVSLVALLLACPWRCVCSQELVDEDISMIKNNSNFCTDVTVSGLTVTSSQTPSSVEVSWTPVLQPQSSGYQYEIVYRPLSTSTVQFQRVDISRTEETINGLQDSTRYEFYIRLACPSGGFGNISSEVPITLVDTLPEGVVEGVFAGVNGSIVTVSWNPLPESQWNGIPRGYFIYLYRQQNDERPYTYHEVGYPLTSSAIGLRDGTYYISIVALNMYGFSAQESVRVKVVVGNGVMRPGGNPADVQVLQYPWVYIFIPGLICLIIIVVITIVIFKKVHESRKRTVTYCRDIEEKMYTSGFNNVIPTNNLSSPVTSTSLSIPNSSPTASCSAPQPNPLATRPLPNSPTSEVSPTFIEHDIQFGNGLPSNHRPERKMPHPGGLPMLHENAEPGFVPMHRTNTNQSVFSTSAAAPPAHHVPRTRNRAQTVGGIPSPYEVPEQNGNTLPRSGDRPSTAHTTHHGNVFQIGAGGIPPPPAHSPPPLTHSSMEIRARMGEEQVFSPPGQHTLPRSIGSSRSYSTTSHGSSGGPGGGGHMRHMKSDGHLPHLPILEGLPTLETHEEKMVYIQPPLDSSVEASIHSASSYGAGRAEVSTGGETQVSPPHQHQHQPFQGQLPQHSHSMRGPNTGAMATYVPDSESFSEMTSDAGSMQSAIPRSRHAPPYNRERSNQSHGRESVFSETSTELSMSSNSEKELSPTGWDHRGTTSEVGVGFLHHRDKSPVEREAYSDVGTPGQLPNHSHRVFKQV